MNYAVIMSGGSGTRFWPKSTKNNPKQLLHLYGGKSLLQHTTERIGKLIKPANIYCVTNRDIVGGVEENMPGVPKENIIAEPSRRNTAPCVALAAKMLYKKDKNAIMIVLPSDHYIRDEDGFISILKKACSIVKKYKVLVTLGITPETPHTGYGYIHAGKNYEKTGALRVKCFVEKPDLETAQKYLLEGNYYWNGGIFIWKAADILEAIKTFEPGIHRNIESLEAFTGKDLEKAYNKMPSISIDYAVMEKADNVLTIPSNIGWNDLGSWPSLEDVAVETPEGVVVADGFRAIDTSGCIVHCEGKFVTTIGVKNLIVVSHGNVIMVCEKGRSQDIKTIVEKLVEQKKTEYL